MNEVLEEYIKKFAETGVTMNEELIREFMKVIGKFAIDMVDSLTKGVWSVDELIKTLREAFDIVG